LICYYQNLTLSIILISGWRYWRKTRSIDYIIWGRPETGYFTASTSALSTLHTNAHESKYKSSIPICQPPYHRLGMYIIIRKFYLPSPLFRYDFVFTRNNGAQGKFWKKKVKMWMIYKVDIVFFMNVNELWNLKVYKKKE
jgi:hypothetical protein